MKQRSMQRNAEVGLFTKPSNLYQFDRLNGGKYETNYIVAMKCTTHFLATSLGYYRNYL